MWRTDYKSRAVLVTGYTIDLPAYSSLGSYIGLLYRIIGLERAQFK